MDFSLAFLLFEKMASLFLILFAGWALVRTKLLKAEMGKTISVILLYVIVPCATVNSFIKNAQDAQNAQGLILGLAVLLGAAVLIQGGFISMSALLKKPLTLNAIEQTSVAYTNAGNLILPLITAMLGEGYIVYCVPFMAVQTVFLWTHCRNCISGDTGVQWKKILLNPAILAIPLGLVLFFTRPQLPYIVTETLTSVSTMIGPCTMLVVGMLLGGMSLKKMMSYRKLWLVVALRLVALPLIALLFLRFVLTPFLPEEISRLLLITLLAAAAPAGATVTNMAQLYDKDADYAGTINVMTMLCCIITMPLLTALYTLIS